MNCNTDATGRSLSTNNSNICLNKLPKTKIKLNETTPRTVDDSTCLDIYLKDRLKR